MSGTVTGAATTAPPIVSRRNPATTKATTPTARHRRSLSTPPRVQRSALEEELRLLRVEQQPQLVPEQVVVRQRRLLVDQRERHLARPHHPLPVPAQRRQLQVGLALLARAQH